MIKIDKQPIVTSSVDRHGDQIPLNVLEQFFEQMPDPWVMNNNHDISKPPMGIGYNKQFSVNLMIKLGQYFLMSKFGMKKNSKKWVGLAFRIREIKLALGPKKKET